jgi:hypothetical protein
VVGNLRSVTGALALVVTVSAVACTTGGAGPTASLSPSSTNTGIRGTVLIGPRCPDPKPPTRLCLEPYSARLVIIDTQGDPVAEATSDANGRFELALPPGLYTIVPAPPGADPFPSSEAIPVQVGEDDYTQVEIRYDTGIR